MKIYVQPLLRSSSHSHLNPSRLYLRNHTQTKEREFNPLHICSRLKKIELQ